MCPGIPSPSMQCRILSSISTARTRIFTVALPLQHGKCVKETLLVSVSSDGNEAATFGVTSCTRTGLFVDVCSHRRFPLPRTSRLPMSTTASHLVIERSSLFSSPFT
eukprot:6181459-Prorocentrum_lima.AAC.1